MGIPGFASRIRSAGTITIIGQLGGDHERHHHGQDHTQAPHAARQIRTTRKLAIVDGPALAHSVYQTFIKDVDANDDVQVHYSYSALAKYAIDWLDRLQAYGFKIEGIYFDGALPSTKRQTRMDRLEKHVQNLISYKQFRDRPHIPESDWARLQAARNRLPPPPFLVSAVVESLFDSEYADRTWVVDGEADGFCAAAAYEQARGNNPWKGIAIFTNDSDLVIWNSGMHTRIVMINEIKEQVLQDGCSVLKALQFWPFHMRTHLGPQPLPDLVRPAFSMLDPYMAFQEALAITDIDDTSDVYLAFAGQYAVILPLDQLDLQKEERRTKKEYALTDPRISEMTNHALSAIRWSDEDEANKGNRTQGNTSVSNPRVATQNPKRLMKIAKKVQRPVKLKKNQSTSSYQASSGESSDQKPIVKLDMFLPMLFENPSKSAAWRIGVPLRNAAESIATAFLNDYECSVLEYKRTGHGIKETEVLITSSIDEVHKQLIDWVKYIRSALKVAKELGEPARWRFCVMQLTLGEMKQQGKSLPYVKDVLHVVNGGTLRDWDQVHLSAQYQAAYYSLKMLKDVIAWLGTLLRLIGMNNPLYRMHAGLRDLPKIVEFFETADTGIDQEQWQSLEAEFREREEARSNSQ